MEQINFKVQDGNIKNNEGKPIVGGQSFRQYLLNWCREDFERGWDAKDAAAAVAKASEDEVTKPANDKSDGDSRASVLLRRILRRTEGEMSGLDDQVHRRVVQAADVDRAYHARMC